MDHANHIVLARPLNKAIVDSHGKKIHYWHDYLIRLPFPVLFLHPVCEGTIFSH